MSHGGTRPRHESVRATLLAVFLGALAACLIGGPAAALAYPVTEIAGVPGSWSRGDVTFTLTATAYDSPPTTFYKLVGPGASGAWNVYAEPVTVSAEGTTVVYAYTKDSHTTPGDTVWDNIRIDRTAPTSAIYGIDPGWDSSRTVTFSIAAADAYSGCDATYFSVNGGARQRYMGPVSIAASATTWVDYWSVDVAGNSEAPRTATILVDNSLPRTTVAGVPDGWTNSPVTFSFRVASLSPPVTTYYQFDGGPPSVYAAPVTLTAEGVTTLSYASVDALGTREATRTALVRIDTTPPSSGVSGAPAGWSNSVARLAFSAFDGGSGVDAIHCRVGGGAWLEGSSATIAAPGTTSFEWYAQDEAGNTEGTHSGSVSLDFTAPSTSLTAQPALSATGPVTLSLTASDTYSGVATTFYSLDGGASVPYAGPVTITKLGTTSVSFWSRDAAGNVEAGKAESIEISLPPVGPAPVTSASLLPAAPDGSSGWYRNRPTLTISRDIPGTTYVKAAGDLAYAASSASSIAAPLQEGDVLYTYFGVSSAGVTETPAHIARVKLDTAAPSTASDCAGAYTGAAAIRLTATDAASGSGVAHTYYALDAAAPAEGTAVTATAVGSHSLEYWSVDEAGNVESPRKVAGFTVAPGDDATPPRTTSDAAAAYAGSATVRLSAFDEPGGSGVAHTYYVLDGAARVEGTTAVTTAPGDHRLEFWSVDAAGNVELPHHVVTFVVAASAHTVTSSAGPGGTIAPSGLQAVAHGADSPTFTVTPAPGFRIADVLVDGASVGAVGAFRFTGVVADHTIAAVFAALTHTVTASAGTGGSISPSGARIVAHGADSPTFTVTPAGGFRIADVRVDGASVGAVSTFRFHDVTADHTIAATFEEDVKAPAALTISTSASSVRIGKTFVLSGAASPDPGMVGSVVHVEVKKPGRRYWTYSSARGVFASGGRAQWWYRYYAKPGMTRGVYSFRVVYDGPAYLTFTSRTVQVTLR